MTDTKQRFTVRWTCEASGKFRIHSHEIEEDMSEEDLDELLDELLEESARMKASDYISNRDEFMAWARAVVAARGEET